MHACKSRSDISHYQRKKEKRNYLVCDVMSAEQEQKEYIYIYISDMSNGVTTIEY